MFSTKKKYMDAVNTKGIFCNRFEERRPQTVIAEMILNHFERSERIPSVCLSAGTAAAPMQ